MKFDFKKFFKQVYEKALEEDVVSNAAQVGFYFIFALFPLLLFLLSLFGIILESAETIRQELFVYLKQLIPGAAFELIEKTLTEVVQESSGGKLTLGFIIALWSASAGIDSIRIALNDVYDLKETRPWWKYKLTSLLLTLGIALLTIFALGIIFYGSQFLSLLLGVVGLAVQSSWILSVLSFIIVTAAMMSAFALLYAFAPNHDPFAWKWITPGAITAIILWLLFSFGFRLYLTYFDSYAKTYGSVGAIIILLLWLYLTALVILIGGVVNAVADKFSASNIKTKKDENTKKDEK
ncbi:MAG: YihY/virulence factor BrkB family protein [Actinomycetota bacterium]